jgi:cell division protein FtsI/penicillin-binding protein 2
MNFVRCISCLLYHRRRRKQNFFFFIFVILLMTSFLCYWWIEIYSHDNNIELFDKQIENNDLEKTHPIFSKYIQDPYNINVRNIINEANRKYEDNNNKYLVYSCPFMCGGKIFIFVFE